MLSGYLQLHTYVRLLVLFALTGSLDCDDHAIKCT